eukprot:GHVQ01043478.1.p1 GENE.GHVQ01043478.1~~GHVQ01043478.1.p1  ORF type:complete len:268 (-),score=43.15 GHVQ01043478.1:1141-1944(-)
MRSSHSTPMASHSSSSSSVDGGESHCHATKLYVNKTDDIICFLDYVLDILYSVRPSSTTPILHVRGHVGIPQKGRTLDVNISTQTSAVSGEGAKYGWRVEEEVKGMGVSVKTREEDEGNSVDRSDVSMEMSLRQDIHSLLSEHDTFLCRDKQSEDVKKENKITMEGEGKDEKGRVKVRKEGGVDDMSVIENAVHQSECVEVDCLIKLVSYIYLYLLTFTCKLHLSTHIILLTFILCATTIIGSFLLSSSVPSHSPVPSLSSVHMYLV